MTAITLTDPVGPQEIADRLGVDTATVYSWRARAPKMKRQAGLPTEEATVSNVPLWSWETIAAWARETGRMK